jgi:hypothetical protein
MHYYFAKKSLIFSLTNKLSMSRVERSRRGIPMSKDYSIVLIMICLVSINLSVIVYRNSDIVLIYKAEYDSAGDWELGWWEVWHPYTKARGWWIFIPVSVWFSFLWCIIFMRSKIHPKTFNKILSWLGFMGIICSVTCVILILKAPVQEGVRCTIVGGEVFAHIRKENITRDIHQFPEIFVPVHAQWVFWLVGTMSFLQPLYAIPPFITWRSIKKGAQWYLLRKRNNLLLEFQRAILEGKESSLQQILDEEAKLCAKFRKMGIKYSPIIESVNTNITQTYLYAIKDAITIMDFAQRFKITEQEAKKLLIYSIKTGLIDGYLIRGEKEFITSEKLHKCLREMLE